MIYFVQIVEYKTGIVIKELGPHSEHKAEKIEAGLNIQINHESYYTKIIQK